MTAYRWVRVAPAHAVPVREGRAVRLDDREVAVFNLGGRFFAVDNRCPHRGGPLADGMVTGASVVCPLHTWKIDLERGCVQRPAGTSAACLRTYPVRIADGTIVVGLPVDVAPAVARRSPGDAA